MNTERMLLGAALDSRSAFDMIERHLDFGDLTEPAKVVIAHVQEYYERDPSAQRIDPSVLREQVLQSVANPKHKETFGRIMDALGEQQVSGVNVAHVLIGAKREALGSRISQKLASGDDAGVVEMMQEYEDLTKATELEADERKVEVLHAPKLAELFSPERTGERIHMYPKALDERLNGGMFRGQHALVFARPEMGKTMFICNLVFGFIAQGLKTLYVCNEEPLPLTASRMVGRLTGMTQYEIARDYAAADAAALEKGWDLVDAVQLYPGTLREIDALCAEHEPDVLIVDQLRNISMKEDNFVRQLEKAANGVRTIGGKHNCLVVSVTQAGDSASGKPVLDMGDVDSSNTGIPGAVDVMIGIGATDEDEAAGRRVISLPKNKTGGGHEFFPVRVNPALSKITSMDR